MPEQKVELGAFANIGFAKECLFRLRRLSRVRAVGILKEKSRIENTLREIIAYIKRHPHQENEAKTTLRTCISATERLVFAWKEAEKPNPSGANVKRTKAQIKQGLEDIANTLDNLFDSLFAMRSMDISAEIKAAKALIDLDKK